MQKTSSPLQRGGEGRQGWGKGLSFRVSRLTYHTHTNHTHTKPNRTEPNRTETQRIIGFKEIRHSELDDLNWFKQVFPNARFIFNWREDHASQMDSAFNKKLSPTQKNNKVEKVSQQEDNFQTWSKEQGKWRTFNLPLEQYSVEKFNELIKWIGYEGCEFKMVLQVRLVWQF